MIGYDAKDERLFDLTVDAPNKAVAHMMVLAQLRRNFSTAPLADRADTLVVCCQSEKAGDDLQLPDN